MMLQRTLATLLLSTCVAGTAHATTWHFTATDIDGDGNISQEELTHLSLGDWKEYAGPGDCGDLSGWFHCWLQGFRYDFRDTLNFSAGWHYFDYPSNNSWEVVAGAYIFSYQSAGADERRQTLHWTPDTVFAITPPPVPEPSNVAMSALGLVALAGVHRRHRHSARTVAEPKAIQ